MKIEHTEIFGFVAAFRGMRHSRKTHSKSDSKSAAIIGVQFYDTFTCGQRNIFYETEHFVLGPNDKKLAQSLILAGNEHAKFMRYIIVWADFTLPLDIWSELDTYGVGPITRNSESTMYLLGKRDLVKTDFEDEIISDSVLNELNEIALKMRQAQIIKDHLSEEQLHYSLKKRLPSGYLLTSTMIFNYQNLRNIYFQRKNHKLPQWNIKERNKKYSICRWIQDLPYAQELICLRKN